LLRILGLQGFWRDGHKTAEHMGAAIIALILVVQRQGRRLWRE
jgi:hypothetical protein